MAAELTVAVPQGALYQDTLDLLDALGLNTAEPRSDSRKLLFESVGSFSGMSVSVITMRPSDVPTYVENGAAQLGVTGKDVLMEQQERDLYELVDLQYGACTMVFATPDTEIERRRPGLLRVASKYPRVTNRYFAETGRQVEVLAVKGSVELAPIAGLADGIVDLVATGNTLRANDLTVREEITQCTARLIINSVAYKMLSGVVDEVGQKARQWRDGREATN